MKWCQVSAFIYFELPVDIDGGESERYRAPGRLPNGRGKTLKISANPEKTTVAA
jgi:hypothetical protein